MLAQLRKAKEIAIDLEHHEVHSYIGMVSLMQISTRDQDWIVDTLKPWRRKLEILNEVFTDPSIVKVLHGAHMDIIWLQRDLGLYVVGLFDTHHASRALGYSGGSLAFLLKKFIDFDAQKQYQTADWRLRPLPTEMFEYARSDTHFLLHIYDCMRNELIEKSDLTAEDGDLIARVLRRSKDVALNRYEHPFYDDTYAGGRNGWFSLLSKHPSDLSKEQLAVFARVHRWRDEIAREEDEGLHYVMPSYVIFNIARAQPRDRAALLGACHPISPIVRMRADELLAVVQQAISEAPDFPSIPPVLAYGTGMQVAHAVETGVPRTQSAQQQPPPPGVDLHDLQMQVSRFWGHTLSHRPSPPPAPSIPAFTMTFPGLSNSTSQQVSTSNDAKPPVTAVNSSSHLTSRYEGLGKRKLASPPVNETSAPSTNNVGENAFDKVQRRAARKAAKKACKEAQQIASGQTNGYPAETVETKPFDYEAAPSVLHADLRPYAQQKGVKQSVASPYAKGDAAPAGLKRVQNMKVGRSTTFK